VVKADDLVKQLNPQGHHRIPGFVDRSIDSPVELVLMTVRPIAEQRMEPQALADLFKLVFRFGL
jgi:hypothetical protein